MYTTLSCVVRS